VLFSSSRCLSAVCSLPLSAEEAEEVRTWLETFSRASIPTADFSYIFSRSSGPGGQNVNKRMTAARDFCCLPVIFSLATGSLLAVNTKVDLRFVLSAQTWMPAAVRRRLRELEGGRLNADGEFIITSVSAHRS
jgi:protein subunit release factor B